jgi:hypothetical protein
MPARAGRRRRWWWRDDAGGLDDARAYRGRHRHPPLPSAAQVGPCERWMPPSPHARSRHPWHAAATDGQPVCAPADRRQVMEDGVGWAGGCAIHGVAQQHSSGRHSAASSVHDLWKRRDLSRLKRADILHLWHPKKLVLYLIILQQDFELESHFVDITDILMHDHPIVIGTGPQDGTPSPRRSYARSNSTPTGRLRESSEASGACCRRSTTCAFARGYRDRKRKARKIIASRQIKSDHYL